MSNSTQVSQRDAADILASQFEILAVHNPSPGSTRLIFDDIRDGHDVFALDIHDAAYGGGVDMRLSMIPIPQISNPTAGGTFVTGNAVTSRAELKRLIGTLNWLGIARRGQTPVAQRVAS